MITIENGFEDTSVVIMDPDGNLEDVEVLLYDDGVFIRQWDDDLNANDLIQFSHNTFQMFLTALNLPEGIYVTKRTKR